MHAKEAPRPSNSAHLLARLVPGTRFVVHGAPAEAEGSADDSPDDSADDSPAPMAVETVLTPPAFVLFPDDDAPELTPTDAPATLVVPDGNWRQCRRMVRRVPFMADLPRRRLPPGPPPLARLRGHPEADHLATLEAVARAVGVLAGPAAAAPLEAAWLEFAARVTRWRAGGI